MAHGAPTHATITGDNRSGPFGGAAQEPRPTDCGTTFSAPHVLATFTAMAGADVYQCRAQRSDGSLAGDTCPRAGGLDQNIYGDLAP